jgi:small-conductance mechanosensitive channel
MRFYFLRLLLVAIVLLAIQPTASDAQNETEDGSPKPNIIFSDQMNDTVLAEAARVKEEFKQKARSLFVREPLGWSWKTIETIPFWTARLPQRMPDIARFVAEQGRVLGTAGSLVVALFLLAVLYSLLGRQRLFDLAAAKIQPLEEKVPPRIFPFCWCLLRVFLAALLPLLLYAVYSLINAMIRYEADWFRLSGRLLWLWAIGAVIIGLLRELFLEDYILATKEYGRTVFRLGRVAVLAILFGTAIFWSAEAFEIRADVLALVRFSISVIVILVLFFLLLRKRAFLSLLPDFPYQSYRWFIRFIRSNYYPLLIFSFMVALLWCIGYRNLGRIVLFKLWSSALAVILITIVYHHTREWLQNWRDRTSHENEAERELIGSLKSLLTYAAIIATIIIGLNLLGLLEIIERLLSFPVFQVGQKAITCWIILKAVLILLAFLYASRLVQAYLDFKIYPALGIDTGLGYALNTTLKYLVLLAGFLVALNVVGIDLRFLLVFAGAIGIGIGFGLQGMAANIISGFTIIFGGKIRKGDWIEVGTTLGVVTDIYLRATKVRTRDNIEYLIPNAKLISETIVNYSLSSPMIRIELPVGVSYSADPQVVKRILEAAAAREPLVEKYQPPAARFTEYGDSSINFELLFWINVQKTARRKVRSALYFAIFEELQTAGIEIPFPQRDLHIRSKVAGGDESS